MTDITYTPIETIPDNFMPLARYELQPDDISTTPPATATLYMSEEFTNEHGADDEQNKARDYVIEIDYPEVLDDTVIKMTDVPTWAGSKMFRKFVDNTADEKGYTKNRVGMEKLVA